MIFIPKGDSSSSSSSSLSSSSLESSSAHEVNFSLNGYYGEETPGPQSVADGGFATAPTVGKRTGYSLLGWSVDRSESNLWSFSASPVKANLTLYAVWSLETYTVHFDLNGGSGSAIPDQQTTYLAYDSDGLTSKIIAPSSSLTKEGFILDGWWMKDETGSFSREWNFTSDLVLGDMTLYAGWATVLNYDHYLVHEYETAVKISLYDRTLISGIITIPSTIAEKPVLSIGASAFANYDNTETTNIVLPSSLTTIGASAFRSCSAVYELTIPDTVQSIGEMAFHSCSGLYTLKLGSGLKNIGQKAFYQCQNLNLDGVLTLPSGLISIEHEAFSISAASGSPLSNVVFSKGLEYIGWQAFYYANIQTMTLPDSLIYIGADAFRYCRDLAIIHFGLGLEEIGNNAFESANANHPNVLHVYLPSSVPPLLGNYVFGLFQIVEEEPSRTDLWFIVPSAAVETYEAAPTWSLYSTRIISIALE